jgi:hypothetical protein
VAEPPSALPYFARRLCFLALRYRNGCREVLALAGRMQRCAGACQIGLKTLPWDPKPTQNLQAANPSVFAVVPPEKQRFRPENQ